ncbi:Bug family tripartite tricarboxylate transporter substrate binding protein [Humitalea sp. 24SJ18S-53]|uniref:Bug family tripartite tricarboxylate transporter substrate binding protein n=1 Tax=Humitalea sp. 24SJ18S-53 TaxID=3422307 RepID=UPI003D67716A
MTTSRRALLQAAAIAAAAPSLAPTPVQAQAWPTRPVSVIMPLQAGSASDIAVRILAEKMGETLGNRMVVENITGAAGLVGAERAARAAPDGYTLAALNNSILTILPNVQRRRLGFDPFADFLPIGGIATIPTFLGVHKDVPVQNVQELIALAKARNGEMTYASGGAGSPQHLATEMFMSMAGVKMVDVPYRGASAAAADLAAGHVQVMFIAHSLAIPFLDSGMVRLIGFAGPERNPLLPAIPTVAEQGVAGFDYSSWIALFAPKETPAPILARLRADCAAATADPALQERLARSGLAAWPRDPAAVVAVMREDDTRWKAVVQAADIRI